MKFFGLTILIISIFGLACNKQKEADVASNAKSVPTVRTDTRNIDGFKKIKAESAVELSVKIAEGYSVIVKGDNEVVGNVTTKLDGETLIISLKGDAKSKVEVLITLPVLTDLDLLGATTATVSGVKTDTININAAGASKVNMEGEVKSLKIKAIGASSVNAENLRAEKAEVESVGASNITVSASNELKADATGASSVTYIGDPKSLKQNASDVSTINKK